METPQMVATFTVKLIMSVFHGQFYYYSITILLHLIPLTVLVEPMPLCIPEVVKYSSSLRYYHHPHHHQWTKACNPLLITVHCHISVTVTGSETW